MDKSRTPMIAAFFVQDKFEVSDLIVNIGMRYDHVDRPIKYLIQQRAGNQNIIITDAGTLGRNSYYTDLDGDGAGDPMEYMYSEPTADDATGLDHQVKAPVSAQWSPRIGLAFPVRINSVSRNVW
jgi:outer membrane receptor protein involved in Fe transport